MNIYLFGNHFPNASLREFKFLLGGVTELKIKTLMHHLRLLQGYQEYQQQLRGWIEIVGY